MGRSRLETWAHEQRDGHKARVTALFEQHAEDSNPDLLRKIRLELNRWRYMERMIEQMDPRTRVDSEVPE